MDNSNNIQSPINCLNPSIVLNSNYKDLYYRCKRAVYLDSCTGSYSYIYRKDDVDLDRITKLFVAIKLTHVSIDNCYGNFYFEMANGKHIPMFYLFPCGRCKLCLDKKSSEYSFRAACETAVYPENPLFVTLTYKDCYLPNEGVSLYDLQRFFKRLRFKFQSLGLPTDFRYLAVSEYGAKYGRPHYHIIFWNLPSMPLNKQLRLHSYIRFAWCTYVLDDDGKRVMVYSEKNKKFYAKRTSIGIVKILPVAKGCTSYIVKYFRKEGHNKLNYPNKTFLVSSRGNGGIGSRYIKSQRDFILSSKNVPSLKVFEPNVQKFFEYPCIGYIKRVLFPSFSGCYKESVYRYCKMASNCVFQMKALSDLIVDRDFCTKLDVFRYPQVRTFLKLTKYFFRYYGQKFNLNNYTHYRYFSIKELIAESCKIFARFACYLKKIDFSLVCKGNDRYRESLLIADRLHCDDDSVRYYYNIPFNIAYSDESYRSYNIKCVF